MGKNLNIVLGLGFLTMLFLVGWQHTIPGNYRVPVVILLTALYVAVSYILSADIRLFKPSLLLIFYSGMFFMFLISIGIGSTLRALLN